MGVILDPRFDMTLDEGLVLVAFMKPEPIDRDEFFKVVKAGSVIAVDDNKNLPVYCSVTDFVQDVIESDFNPDVDKTLHFTSADLNNIVLWKVKPLGDLAPTGSRCVKLAMAVLLMAPMNMDAIRTEVRLNAAKYGKELEAPKPELFPDIDILLPPGV